jgi:hypothetical protein
MRRDFWNIPWRGTPLFLLSICLSGDDFHMPREAEYSVFLQPRREWSQNFGDKPTAYFPLTEEPVRARGPVAFPPPAQGSQTTEISPGEALHYLSRLSFSREMSETIPSACRARLVTLVFFQPRSEWSQNLGKSQT